MASARKKIAVFLGAGASVEFGKPTTPQIKQVLGTSYPTTSPLLSPEALLASLLNTPELVDIEGVLQAIIELESDKSRYSFKYLTSQSHLSYIQTGSHSVPITSIMKYLAPARELLEEEIFRAYRWNNKDNPKLIAIYNQLFGEILKISDSVSVFTTNYDKAIETYCRVWHERFSLIDGFKPNTGIDAYTWARENYIPLASTSNSKKVNLFLYKLHGSLDWIKDEDGNIIKTNMEQKSHDPNALSNMLIWPTVSPKEGEQKEPFKTILGLFSEFIQNADALIVIGCSFRDNPIKNIFKQLNGSAPFVIVSPKADFTFKVNFYEASEDPELWKDLKFDNWNSLCIDEKFSVETIGSLTTKIMTHIKAS